ncbi:hypothetical protein [Pseudidiomarina insulisalsae]|uniref:DUF3566 domain-containing protein n=1 Tax=Pseudidiomarina insulisalsae TaxID=575789 RepID=A0A432YDJ6_9GAMM|nr:hypothetical protein [Pseudidiomarina insulisalsae]RUO59011.1 hypothetical protein CWI71_09325 [Pseudidiomarina insulisalsae]
MNRITYIEPHKAAVVCALVAFWATILGFLPLSLLMGLVGLIGNFDAGATMIFSYSLFSVILAPVFYAIFTYIFVLIITWVYNLVAKKTGGIAFKVSREQQHPQETIGNADV